MMGMAVKPSWRRQARARQALQFLSGVFVSFTWQGSQRGCVGDRTGCCLTPPVPHMGHLGEQHVPGRAGLHYMRCLASQ